MLEEEKVIVEETSEELQAETNEVINEESVEFESQVESDETTKEHIDESMASAEDLKKEKSTKSIFKKEKKKDPKDEKIEDLNDRLIRNMAEFDNYRKRSEKEKSQMFEIGAKNIIEKMLPVIDNFERGFDMITEEEKESAFTQGIDKIYKQLITTLEEVGVKPIEAVGKEFNPDFHNAVMHAEDENFGENTITDEFQKGYMYKDSIVRYSMVKVVN